MQIPALIFASILIVTGTVRAGAILEIYAVAPEASSSTRELVYETDSGKFKLNVEAPPLVTDDAVASARAGENDNREVIVVFSEEGGRKFNEAIKALYGRQLAVVVDGVVVCAPVLMTTNLGGQISITGFKSEKEAADMMARLNQK